MPAQDGLRFLFDLDDKITAKLVKIEAKAKASAAKIDKAFTKASKSQETNTAKAIKAEERLVAATEKARLKAIALIKRQSDAFKRSMTRMASAATVAFAVVAGKALDMAGGYDAAMRSVQAKTGATGALLDKLSAQAREMGRTTVHSATAAARGQAFLAAAGFDAQQILEALPPTLALATAGELDLASAADITSNVMAGFRLETDQTGRVVDVLALAAASSNTSVAQMGAAMAKAAPAAAAAGWSLEATAASIGKLSDAGIQGEEAGTVLNTMMARLGNASGSAEAKLRELGIEVKDATTGAMLPLNDILTALAPHADDVGLQFELLGNRGAKAGFILGAVSGDARKLTGELKNAGGTAQSMADIMAGGLWGSLKAIGSLVDSAYISFGERLAPALQKGLDLFKKLPAPIQEVVVITGSLVGAMGGLMLIAPGSFGAIVQFPGKLIALAKSLKLVTAAQWLYNAALTANPIGLVVAAVALLSAGLYLLWKRYNSVQEAFDASVLSTEDLTARYDDLTEKVAAATAKLERAQKTLARGVPIAAKALRALVAERDELERHIQQRAETEKAANKLEEAEKKAAKAKAKAAAAAASAAAKAAAAYQKAAEAEAKAAKEAARAAVQHAKKIADLGQTLQGLPTKAAIKEFEDLREAWVLMETDEQEKAMDAYSDALIEAEEAGHDLDKTERAMNVTRKWTLVLERRLEEAFINGQAAAKKRAEANKEAIDAETESLVALRGALLGLPTAAVVDDFGRLKRVWEEMDEAEKIRATDEYAEALGRAAENGIELSAAEVAIAESGSKMGDAWVDGFFGTMKQAFEGGGGFMGGIKSMASQAFGQMFSKIGGESGGGFTDALGKIFSGDGLLGKIGGKLQGFGSGMSKFMSLGISGIPLVGPLLATFGPALIKGIGKLAGKVWGAIKSLFGGPSEAEKSGRKVAHEFRQGIIEGLTPEQFTEVGESWKQGWDSSVIVAVRDAAMAGGATFEAATALGNTMFNALWAAEKEGPEAVQRVIDQINTILTEGNAAAEALVLAAEDRARRIQEFQDEIDDIERQRIAKRLEFELAAIEDARDDALEVMRDRHEKELEAIEEQRDAKMEELRQGKADALALIEEERDAALEVLRGKHTAELEAIAEARSAKMEELNQGKADALAAIEEERDDALEVLKGQHEVELTALDNQAAARLTALKERHAAELTEIERARDDALSPFEKAIKDELDDAEIAVQLVVDLKKAGWDAEKIDAANQRAAEATARLEERREIKTLMDAEEARIRAKYQPEIDEINDHYDDKIEVATTKHKIEVEEEKAYSKSLRDEMEDRHEAEIQAVNDTFDAKRDKATKYWDTLILKWGVHFDDLERSTKLRHEAEIQAVNDTFDAKRDKAIEYWDGQIEDWEQYYDDLVDETKDRHEDEIDALNAHYDALIDAAKGIIRRSLAEWEQYYDDLADAARQGIADVEAEAPAPTVDPPPAPPPATSTAAPAAPQHTHSNFGFVNHDPWHTGSWHEHDAFAGGRQHGGPVSAGQRYRVGEGGPEMFIPSERGRIEPHGSSGGGASAKDLARAVAESLEGMAVNVDGRKLGRLTIRHQPLAIAELGGQR